MTPDDVARQLLDPDERVVVEREAERCLARWREAEPEVHALPVERAYQMADGVARSSLVALSRAGIEHALAKMAIAVVLLFDAASSHDRVLVERIVENDYLLTQHRSLGAMILREDDVVYWRDLEGVTRFRYRRQFPMWLQEAKDDITGPDHALAFYEHQCKSRGIA